MAGLDPTVWVSPASLHLTVIMLKLYSGEARRLACEVMPIPRPGSIHRALQLSLQACMRVRTPCCSCAGQSRLSRLLATIT